MDCKLHVFKVGNSDRWISSCRPNGMSPRACFLLSKVVCSPSGHNTDCVDKGMFLLLSSTHKPPCWLAGTVCPSLVLSILPLPNPGCCHHGTHLYWASVLPTLDLLHSQEDSESHPDRAKLPQHNPLPASSGQRESHSQTLLRPRRCCRNTLLHTQLWNVCGPRTCLRPWM